MTDGLYILLYILHEVVADAAREKKWLEPQKKKKQYSSSLGGKHAIQENSIEVTQVEILPNMEHEFYNLVYVNGKVIRYKYAMQSPDNISDITVYFNSIKTSLQTGIDKM
ncbi:hypothetical protein ACJX0J_039282, partial [Zea mays]